MEKLIFGFVFLAAFSANVLAEDWTYITRDEDSALWAKKGSVWQTGETLKMWTMTDYRVAIPSLNRPPAPVTLRSTVSLFEYDCIDHRTRILEGKAYEDAKGTGRIAFSIDKPEAWAYVKPGSLVEKHWNLVCRKPD